MSDPGVLLVAEVHGRAALAEELGRVLEELTRETLTEPECVGFRVLRSQTPSEFVLLGAWSGEAGMRAHYQTPHYRRYREHVAPFISRSSDVVVHHVSQTVHARDPDPPDPGLLG